MQDIIYMRTKNLIKRNIYKILKKKITPFKRLKENIFIEEKYIKQNETNYNSCNIQCTNIASDVRQFRVFRLK